MDLLALYIPATGRARFTRVPVTHVAINGGLSVPAWGRFFEGSARTWEIVEWEGVNYIVVTPDDRSVFPINRALLDAIGWRRRGPMLVFRRGMRSQMLVNMRTDSMAKDDTFDALRECVLFSKTEQAANTRNRFFNGIPDE